MKIPVQKKHNFLISAVFFLLFPFFSLMAEELFCDICQRRIRGKYFLVNKNPCCSRACVEEMQKRLLPSCSLCRKPMKKFVRILSHKGERKFCISCRRLPLCFHCKFPSRTLARLPDGRKNCRECQREALSDPREGERLFREVRNRMKRYLGIGTFHRITFSLSDARRIASLNPESNSREWGLFVCKRFTQTQVRRSRTTGRVLGETKLQERKEYFIYLLSHLSYGSFAQTAAHELTHDYMEEYFPYIKEPLWSEGAAEFVSSLYNIINKNSARNLALEKNEDPVYGDGYRMFCKMIPSHLSPREKAEKLKLLLARKNREERYKKR